MYEFMGSGMGVFWMIPFMLLIWLSIVLLIGKREHSSTALSILKGRYAKGEIDQHEFEKIRDNLNV